MGVYGIDVLYLILFHYFLWKYLFLSVVRFLSVNSVINCKTRQSLNIEQQG